MSKKYGPLEKFLSRQNRDRVRMTFSEIETVIGEKLPHSAYTHRPWWANEERGHSHAAAWLRANYQTSEVDMRARKLTFKHSGKSKPSKNAVTAGPRSASPGSKGHPLVGALKGLLTVEDGHDLTAPALPDWANELDRSLGPEQPR